MTPRELLDPELAPSIEHIPFDDLTPEILATLRGLMGGALPLSDAVDRSDHLVPGDPKVPVRCTGRWVPKARCRASTRCTVAAT